MKFIDFEQKYPNYNTNRFTNVNGKVRFIFNGDEYDPFDENGNLVKKFYEFPTINHHTYEPEDIRDFLYSDDKESGFHQKYRLNKNATYHIIPFDGDVKQNDYSRFYIYITPKEKTGFVFRNIFNHSELKFNSAKESKRWLSPNMSYWSQQLNFAMFCVSSSGVTRDMLDDTQVGSFYKFFVYFTVRRILKEMGCPLPEDNTFSWNNNFYNKSKYEKLKIEFGINSNDFRFISKHGHGLGDVWFYRGSWQKDVTQPNYLPYNSTDQLPDEFQNKDGHFKVSYVTDPITKYQYEYFFSKKSKGLTKAGLSRINQSIEGFVYCILGSQVQTRSSIIGDSASAQETKEVFLKLFENSIIENDISKSIQRYQFAIQKSRVKLDLALALNCWLSPSYLVINDNTSIAGYNNKLQRATSDMKIGINNINVDFNVVQKHNMGDSKVNLPHKTEDKPKKEINVEKDSTNHFNKPSVKPLPTSNRHDTNLAVVTVGVAGIVWYMFR